MESSETMKKGKKFYLLSDANDNFANSTVYILIAIMY